MPAVRYAPHWVSTDELAAAYREHHPRHPRLATWIRMVRSAGVEQRPWLRPPASTGAADGVGPRSRAAYAAARDLAVTAAADALASAGLGADDIDAVVTSHTSSYTVPGLEVDLIRRLGLRPDVSRIGLATAACAGGAHAIAQAARIARDRSDAAVLVVVSEALSTLFHPSGELSLQQVLYSGLFGDSAGAAVVTGEATPTDGRRVPVGEAWEYLLPDSEDAYWGVIDQPGIRFDSGARSRSAPAQVGPALTDWLGRGPAPRWAVVHPGGPGIITTTLEAIGVGPEQGHHARASLAEAGNLGGVAVLDVLARTLAAPVPPAGPGLLVAHGPGFTTTALRLGGVRV